MAILAGQRIRALDFAGYAYATDPADVTVSTGTLDPGSPVFGLSFTAPTGGAVRIVVSAGMSAAASANSFVQCGAQVRTGAAINSGSVVYTASADEVLEIGPGATATAVRLQASSAVIQTGLTPGALYHVVFMSVRAVANATIRNRRLEISPWHG